MGRTGKAVFIGILYALVFIGIPLALISMVSDFLVSNGMNPGDYFHGTERYVIVFGALLSASAAATAYFEKGSASRLVAGIIGAFFLILWGYFFISSMSIFYEGDTYDYEVLVPGIALILALSFSVRLFYRLVEFGVYRREYMNPEQPVPQPYIPHNSPSQQEVEAEEDEEYF